jgi:hypothetical protein
LRYLSNVNVAAILIDLRVVFIEDGVVNACGSGDQVTIIVLLDYISGRAVLSLPSKAVTLANDKVVTCIINDSDVDDSKLVAAGKKNISKGFSTKTRTWRTLKHCWLPRYCHRYRQPERCTCECRSVRKRLQNNKTEKNM